jgi:hypothetical protein
VEKAKPILFVVPPGRGWQILLEQIAFAAFASSWWLFSLPQIIFMCKKTHFITTWLGGQALSSLLSLFLISKIRAFGH